ncbi:MAG: hypothetical protein ACREQJ_00640 [Candidatus Binatia bacterium]
MRLHVPEIPASPSAANVDQRRLRPTEPIRRLSKFLEFLAEIEEIFGPITKTRRIAGGGRFLL